MRMPTLLVVLLAGLTGFVVAQAPSDQAVPKPAPMTLEAALALGPDASAAVLSARASLDAARRTRRRVASDPTSLRTDRISAQNAEANARTALAAAMASNTVDVATAFFNALEADVALAVAKLDAAIQQQTLQAQEARRQAGAATDLDVAQARNSDQQAQSTFADATTQRTLAYNTLGSLLGRDVATLAPVTSVPALGPLDGYLEDASANNAQLTASRNAASLARAQYEAVDNDFSAAADIQAAHDTWTDAQRQVQEVERTLALSVRAAYANAQAALASLTNAQAADATAASNLASAQAQLDAGSISPLAFKNDQMTRQQALQALGSARHGVYLKIYTLQKVVAGS